MAKKSLEEIIGFARKVQGDFAVLDGLKEKAKDYRRELELICRDCENGNCVGKKDHPCEVKKAWNLLMRVA